MPLSPAVKSQIEELIEKNKVVLFMKGNKHFPQCGFSARVIKMLNEVGAKYETVNVLSDPSIRDGIKEFSEWPTIPQLYVNKEFLGGCDIVTEMFNSGELQKALGVTVEEVKAPTLTFSEGAVKAFTEAQEAGTTLRIEITPEFQYELFFDAPQPADIVATVSGLEVRMNRPTAKRADGMRIDFVEVDGGGAFKIENPNEPARSARVEELAQLIASGDKFEMFDARRRRARHREDRPSAYSRCGGRGPAHGPPQGHQDRVPVPPRWSQPRRRRALPQGRLSQRLQSRRRNRRLVPACGQQSTALLKG